MEVSVTLVDDKVKRHIEHKLHDRLPIEIR